jgi:hypothetical protein
LKSNLSRESGRDYITILRHIFDRFVIVHAWLPQQHDECFPVVEDHLLERDPVVELAVCVPRGDKVDIVDLPPRELSNCAFDLT